MSTYLYGVIRRPGPASRLTQQVLATGIDQPPSAVSWLAYKDAAAVVSDVNAGEIGEAAGIRALRRDMIAHTEVQNRILRVRTILPARFGILFPERQSLIDDFLAPEYERLVEQLNRLKGAVELKLRVDYVEEQILQEIAAEQPQLVASGNGGSYHRRIEIGRRIAGAIRQKRDDDRQLLLDALSPIPRDVSTADPASDQAILRASYLVDRKALPKFDEAIQRLEEQAGPRMRLACIGPLPPYSFVDLRVSVGDM